MTGMMEVVDGMNLPAKHRDELCQVLGSLAVLGHKIGLSPADEIEVLALLVEHLAELREAACPSYRELLAEAFNGDIADDEPRFERAF